MPATTTTTKIRLSPEAYSSVCRILSDDDDEFEKQCEQLIAEKKFDKYADSVMQKLNAVMDSNKKNPRAVESFVLVLCVAILEGGRAAEQMKQLAALITAAEAGTVSVKLRVLRAVLNVISAREMPDLHLFMLRELIQFASLHDKNFLRAQFHSKNVDALLARWGYSNSSGVLALLADSTGDVHLYDKYINVFAEGSVGEADEEVVARGVAQAIKDEKYFSFDALRATPVVQKRIKGSATHSKLFELLDIFVSGTYSDYVKFAADANGAKLIESSGMSETEIAKKMRLLTLVTVFSRASASEGTRSIPYATIASELQIDESDVERYVIDAVNSGLCQAKMNQLNRTVNVVMATHREFTVQQWQQIGTQMDLWKSSIGGLLDKLEQNKVKMARSVQHQQQRSAAGHRK